MVAVDLFFNAAKTTVSSGGTTAPAAGTSESWTVTSSALFADYLGQTAATGVTQFRVVDEADTQVPPEVMVVTNVSGTTWTVTRGQESTAPVAHTSGFTVRAIATSANLTSAALLAPTPNPADVGLSAWTMPLIVTGSVAQGSGSGTGMYNRFRWDGGALTSITFGVTVALAGATTGNEVGIYNAAGTLLGKSADLATTMNTTGLKTATLASGALTLAPGYYYAAWLSSGTTAASLLGFIGNTVAGAITGLSTSSTRLAYRGSSAVTALPTSVTFSSLTATANVSWIGLS